MTFAAFVPGHSGGAVPVSHRIPYSSARNKQADPSDRATIYHSSPRFVNVVLRMRASADVHAAFRTPQRATRVAREAR